MIVIDEIDGAAAAGNENNLIKYLELTTMKTSLGGKSAASKNKREYGEIWRTKWQWSWWRKCKQKHFSLLRLVLRQSKKVCFVNW